MTGSTSIRSVPATTHPGKEDVLHVLRPSREHIVRSLRATGRPRSFPDLHFPLGCPSVVGTSTLFIFILLLFISSIFFPSCDESTGKGLRSRVL